MKYNDANYSDGSLDRCEPEFLVIGKLGRTHGIHGEIHMQIHTDFPERIKKNYRVYVGEDHKPFIIRSQRNTNKGFLIAFETYLNPESIQFLKNEWVYVRIDEIPHLQEGEYYHHELIGIKMEDESGQTIGTISQILETGGNDVLVVTSLLGDEVLIPMIPSVVQTINVKDRVIRVHLIDGLI